MKDNKDIKDTVVDNTTGTIVNKDDVSKSDKPKLEPDPNPAIKKSTKKVSKPKQAAKKSLTIDLTKYGNNVKLAVAHAKLEAGLELNKIDIEVLEAERKLIKKSKSLWTRFKNLFKRNKK